MKPLAKTAHWIAAASLILLAAIGCGSANSASNGSDASGDSGPPRLNVVATIGMVGDLVRVIGGPHVDVQQICGTGVDPHQYQPIRDDVQAIMEADVVFYCGLMLEGKMDDTLKSVADTKPVIAVAEEIAEDRLIAPSGAEGHHDPHLWNDVSLWSQCVAVIRDELSKADPDHAEAFAANAESYQGELDRLHRWGVETVSTVPESSRVLVTSHDAFNYFGRAYGLEVMGIQGISTESEAGLQRVNQLIDLLIRRKVRAVFVESSVSAKNIEALIEGAASKGHQVVIGGELFSDAMGAPGSYEGTYIGMLDHNLTTATRALGGQGDAGGFQGKLGAASEP